MQKHVSLGRSDSSNGIRLRLSICLVLILHMRGVLDHMPTLAAPIVCIWTYHALSSMWMSTLATRLSVTLGFCIIPVLGISVLGRFRFTWALVPLHELGPLLDFKQTSTSARTRLIWGLRFLALMASFSLTTLLNLLCMYHQPTKVHVIIQYGCPTILLQILRYTSHKSAHLISTIGHQKISIYGKLNKLQGVFLDSCTSLS